MDQNMTLEKRIAAELYSYHGQMSVLVDDLQGHRVEMSIDEEFETASTIKAYILAALYLPSPSTLWTGRGCCGPWGWGQPSR